MAESKDQEKSLKMKTMTDLTGKEKHIYALLSFAFVIVLTLVLYLVPDYYFLEKITMETVYQVLEMYQFPIEDGGYYNELDSDKSLFVVLYNIFVSLDGHSGDTPVIRSINPSAYRQFAVVRACTGMQAGALLIALIIVTPADSKKKIKATVYSLIALIIGNFLRIALVIAMTVHIQASYGASHTGAWFWAHDVLGKPIGFFGTIFFAIIIERQGVPILNTVSLWIDSFLDLLKNIADKVKKLAK
ncbi:MAG: exosortase/archaeosortase family protein [Candidatus Heimdallarchaeota archaeon]|nr:exosortase/archaeosortase family protein [Candidatus Heimdallarchaeota archaeon]